MKPRINSIIYIIMVCLVTVCFGQEATPGTGMSGGGESVQTQKFPYLAEITGDDVLIRTGPGRGFYDCGKFNKGDKVQVVGNQFTWSKIVPPAGKFSWISMQYVKIDPEDPSYGIVNGDNVRVWAGAENYRPSFSTSLQVKLNKGDKVKLLGEQLDDYYKIIPPSGAYLWISTEFTKPTTPTFEGPMPRIAVTPGVDVSPDSEMTTDANTPATNIITDSNSAVVNIAQSQLEKYYDLQKQLEEERAKPTDQQDYTEIKDALLEIANDENAGKAARYAQAVVEQVKGYELAIEVGKAVKLQNQELKKTIERIDKARADKLAEIKDLGRFAVIGKLENFMTYGAGHYRIVDNSDMTICTALPSETASGKDFSSYVGKKVGLIGTIEPYKQTAGALVRFDDVVVLE
ncbi:MAG: SH3 domain-containing protein [Sedimentisphaerales bacterium]|nr:SH3 domain-containing protein [Sedimentisphaerales bacterium]